MAKNPLQDQLLKAGLVKKQDIKTVNKQQQKQVKQNPSAVVNEAALLAQQAAAEKLARDRALAEQQREALRQKEIAAQIRQIIQHGKQPRGDGDVAYNFTDGKTIKKIHVTQALWDQLGKGQLAIVKLDDRYELVPAKVAEKISERDASYVVAWHKPEEGAVAEDDPYAAYQIPDDLMW